MSKFFSVSLTAISFALSIAGSGYAQERFELTSLKAVRPFLVDVLNALQRKDVAAAKAALGNYDSAWNGPEVYVSTRSRDLYERIENYHQARLTKGLEGATPDLSALVDETQAMLGKYDEMLALVAQSKPLSPLFDDAARLRIVRAHLREVNPALKAGNLAKARKSYSTFDEKWDSIEHLIKERSNDAYVEIEKTMIEIERALEPQKPDSAAVTALVNKVMDQYNTILAQITKEARAAK